jgi:hypothetical protein
MPDSDYRLTGGCGCAAVRFELSAPPVAAGYCHCTRCQHRTGGAWSLQARVAPGSFTITQGADVVGAWRPEGGFAKEFCTRCGSALWSRSPTDPTMVSVRFGAFDSDPGIRPTYRGFVDFAAPFEPIPDDGLARYGGGRPAAPPLDGTHWRGAWSEAAAAATLHFDDWTLAGHSGVNQYSGAYEAPPGTLVIGPVVTTRMAGPEPAMAVERELFALLAGSRPYTIADGTLELGDGAAARRFTAAEPRTDT